mmetsp:Transcript_33920/g.41809  ORF Transcript_33920/g.41809 Transcript_33920/m.41809 type:complete len:355 (+) Transcript_33920:59-1123(+)
MRAVTYSKNGGSEVLEFTTSHPKPVPKSGQLLIKIHACSVNPVDWKIRLIPIPLQPKPFMPGCDFSGEVVEVNGAASEFKVGDRVYGLLPILDKEGTCAEYVCASPNHVAHIPSNLDYVQSAGVPLVGLTVWQAYEKAGLTTNPEANKGKTILCHAGAGGVGSFAIQLAKALGLFVYTTCSERNIDFCKSLGADRPIDYNKEKFEEVKTDYDYVIDTMGGDYELRSMRCIKSNGTYMNIMNSGWATKMKTGKTDGVSGVDSTLGSTIGYLYAGYRMAVQYIIGPYYKFLVVKPDGKMLTRLSKMLETGKVKPIVDRTFPLEKAANAHEYMEAGHAKGKVIIIVDQKEQKESSKL